MPQKSSSLKNLGFRDSKDKSITLRRVSLSRSNSSVNRRNDELYNDDWLKNEIKKQKTELGKILNSKRDKFVVEKLLGNKIKAKYAFFTKTLEKQGVSPEDIREITLHLIKDAEKYGKEGVKNEDKLLAVIRRNFQYVFNKINKHNPIEEKHVILFIITVCLLTMFAGTFLLLITAAIAENIQRNNEEKKYKQFDAKRTARNKKRQFLGNDYSTTSSSTRKNR